MKNKKIVLINPHYGLPIPAIKGGAVETLEDLLIQENSLYEKVQLIVVLPNKKTMVQDSTGVVYYRVNNRGTRYWLVRIINKGLRILHIKKQLVQPYDKRVLRIVKNLNASKIVFEGSCPQTLLKEYSKIFGRENLYLHMHSRCSNENEVDKYIQNYIGVSDYITNEWLSEAKNTDINVYTLKNCVEETRFNKRITEEESFELRKELGFNKEDIVIIFCGRIIPEKGVKELISAVLKVENPRVKLLIIGSPCFAIKTKTTYLNEVEKLVSIAGEKVKFSGYVPNVEMYKYYQMSDIQIVPSTWQEPAGLVVIEGAMSGLPQVCTNSGGMPEYFSDGGVCTIELNDCMVDQLANKIDYLANHKEIREQMAKINLGNSTGFKKVDYYNNFINILEKS